MKNVNIYSATAAKGYGNEISKLISEMVEEYGNTVYKATEKGLDKGANELKEDLHNASPEDTTEFKKSWKVKKYNLKRSIGNTKEVEFSASGRKKFKKGKKIPLINILEYSTVRGKPFVKATFEKDSDKITNIIIEEIKKGI